MKLAQKTFLVSGGSSGLGWASVELLTAEGAFVAILDRAPPPTASPSTKYIEVDITNVSQIEAAVAATVKWTEETGAPLRGVINSAGIGSASKIIDAKNEPHALDVWDYVIAVNLTGTFNLTRLALKHIVKSEPEEGPDAERGVVIMVSSAAAYEGQPGQTAYSASKGAVRSMTLPMARDLARHGVRVVTVAPGVFESSMTQQMAPRVRKNLVAGGVAYPPRFGHPSEFAHTVKWIIECPYVNGETLRLSGGGRLPGKL
ncbi:3-hydroxyacyl-CoA dehydrogenase [Cylindrobasidium torrendii FP15055 ss-10]|uniref:3-hydroxyacyl-CoA dehydrogenase n=1 Tax=Cylindrobasidium torrendii FP15055 ss-10 TaxID=1314674 RepID=A0A0D7BIS0_9AGAR|nr:3-hydroxyacyl-CoA dehydrogenase [Cylindrobasidium torrendii FP15055 ss-10]